MNSMSNNASCRKIRKHPDMYPLWHVLHRKRASVVMPFSRRCGLKRLKISRGRNFRDSERRRRLPSATPGVAWEISGQARKSQDAQPCTGSCPERQTPLSCSEGLPKRGSACTLCLEIDPALQHCRKYISASDAWEHDGQCQWTRDRPHRCQVCLESFLSGKTWRLYLPPRSRLLEREEAWNFILRNNRNGA